ncbi:MAG: ATP synthase F1 subunit gamma [Chloroflexi bacterium]|nr:ATP synthase F1 subunit gamma [Chloroflexota bacterium]MDA1239665.1 ATP synthase F1 subunit gamma [Chloroflexota bacterium]MQC25527.1 ATP synthase F1 subunit gamma [Chloroflexota bacterium]MQC47746.1 ATP synthase F1 subunit gamma [Chloroflexota bacterium]
MAGGGGVRAIRDRIRSVSSTSKVTRAMELVAASKMRRAQERAVASRPYAEQMNAVLSQLASFTAGGDGGPLHPLLERREVKNLAYIHISADRGLAGGLNSNMNRAGAGLLLEHQPHVERVTVIPAGRKGRDFFRRSGFDIAAEFGELGDFPDFSDVRPIARLVMDDFIAGKVDQVMVGYQRFVNAAVQRPTIIQILPVLPPAGTEAKPVDFIFEPSPEELLATLLPRFVEMQIYAAVLEARASEQSARMVAMRQATDAANEMVSDLTLAYNKARQEGITGELLDIVGGVAALEG